MDWGGTSWEPIIEQKCSSEHATNAFRVRSGDLSRADEGRPILPLLLTGEVAIIEKFLYIEKVAHGENPRVATISWEGDSWNILKSWPKSIRLDFGTSLREMQQGRSPRLEVRPMPAIGDGVFELKDSDESTWYRMIYLARKNDVIFVLDCFEKDSRK